MKNTRVRSLRTRLLLLILASALGLGLYAAGPALAAPTASASPSTDVVNGTTITVNVDGSGGYDGATLLAISACGNAAGDGTLLVLDAAGARNPADCFGAEAIASGQLLLEAGPVDGTNYTYQYPWVDSGIGVNGAQCVVGGNIACVINVALLDAATEIISTFEVPISPPEPDTDGDGVDDGSDNCVDDANADQADQNSDGEGDVCDDSDDDGVNDDTDNCVNTPNADQADQNSDGEGDVCDDSDDDGVNDDTDNCVNTPNADQLDSDDPPDGIGDACADDVDGDGVANADDNCPDNANADQADNEGDGAGDVCDDDDDDDAVLDTLDNCALIANPDQIDLDGDGFGTECDEDGDVAPTTTVAPPTTVAPTTVAPPTTAAQVQGSQQLAVTGVDNAPALAAAFGLVMMGLGLMTITRRKDS